MRMVKLPGGLSLPMVTVRDMMAIGESAYQYERATLLANLDAVGMEPRERLDELQQHSSRRGTALLVLMHTYRIEGAAEIIRCAAASAGLCDAAERELASMTPRQMVEAAQALTGYEVASNPQQPSP
jgi:hypothetical protein